MCFSVCTRKFTRVNPPAHLAQILLYISTKQLDIIFVLSNYMQRNDIDIEFAKQLIDVAINSLWTREAMTLLKV